MFPTEAPLFTLTIKATADLVKQRFVDTDGDYPAAAARALGVSRVDVSTGDNFGVHTLGTAIVEAEEAIVAGAAVEVGTDGKAATFSAGVKVGIALTAASADGDFIEVYLIPNA